MLSEMVVVFIPLYPLWVAGPHHQVVQMKST